MYRRCCHLREAPVLKRISEQLGNPKNLSTDQPGVVTSLDLTGSRMQLPDIVCLSDWLAIVPVKRILLQDANLTDEAVRIILAGLLAAKTCKHVRKRGKSSPTRLREKSPRSTAGMIEKLVLKNNPKITQAGWRHILHFLNMSRSIKAVDLSQLPFPQPLKEKSSLMAEPQETNASQDVDIEELLASSLATRIAGSHLEELILAECSLTSGQIGSLVDGVTACGLARLGLANNRLTLEGMAHVARYVASDVCKGLDLAGNNLTEILGPMLKAFHANSPLWMLSLADCNLSRLAWHHSSRHSPD
ncbi:hypothetical protein MRB53_037542 [Persea americana]|nr:hypothetical protein MRB53_037542 [Persea americana]